MSEPYDYGDWIEDYHICGGEYACDVLGGLCRHDDVEASALRIEAAMAAGRWRRPRLKCPSCHQITEILAPPSS